MEQEHDIRLSLSLEDLGFNAENDSNKRKSSKKYYNEDGTKVFLSKNAGSERKRKQRLNTKLFMLWSLVPMVTNMTKESIFNDAITYIKKLKDEVKSLTQELQAMEPKEKFKERAEPKIEVQVEKMDGNKLWVKMIFENKRGGFKKLMETMNDLGLEMIEANVTTIKGAYLITTFIKGMGGQRLDVHQVKHLLQDIIKII
ncbi:helix loop helix DNA-binding domain protein [Medicago truncatula]|uniref:Helix loop helix DNA-binding domain protein n=1 Tax=Medicago truncatula TaxID=3880 RepID=A0A072UQ30_MEDTR|nr:helix loop helix DNA-binding domain protein [Medicago truncatula]